MIKIRLSGTKKELADALVALCDCRCLQLQDVSRFYTDRGSTSFVRVYVDAEINLEDNLDQPRKEHISLDRLIGGT